MRVAASLLVSCLVSVAPAAAQEDDVEAVRGQVVDAASSVPRSGARVELVGYDGEREIHRDRASTDEDGRFELPLRAAAAHNLFVHADGYAPRLGPLPARDEDGALRAIALGRGRSLSGGVWNLAGEPVADAWIFVTAAHAREARPWWAVARTDAEGRFVSEEPVAADAKSGELTLVAVSPEGVGRLPWSPTAGDGGLSPEIVLAQNVSLELRVCVDGVPLAGEAVRALPLVRGWTTLDLARPELFEGGRDALLGVFERTTDARGVADFELPAGAEIRPYALVCRRVIKAFGVPARSFDEELARDLVFDLARVRRATFFGRVIDDDGEPIAGAEVSAPLSDLPSFVLHETARCTSAADGTYRLESAQIVGGLTAIVAQADGHTGDRIDIRIAEEHQGIELDQDFELARYRPIRGRVVDQNGRGLAGIQVHAGRAEGVIAMRRPSPTTIARTSPEGAFAIDDAVAGVYHLLLVSPHSTRTWLGRSWHLVGGGETGLVLQVLDYGPASGRFRLACVDQTTGEPVQPDWAFLYPHRGGSLDGDAWRSYFEPANGVVEDSGIPLGQWTLIVGGEGLHPEHVHLDLTTSRMSVDLAAQMHYPETARVTGRVEFVGGTAPETCWVRAIWHPSEERRVGAQYFQWQALQPGGVFALDGVFDGAVTLEVNAPGYLGSHEMQLDPWGADDVVVRAERAAELSFYAANGTEFGTFVVELARPGEPYLRYSEVRRTTGEDELFELTVPPGEWLWRVRYDRTVRSGRSTAPLAIDFGRLVAEPGDKRRIGVQIVAR